MRDLNLESVLQRLKSALNLKTFADLANELGMQTNTLHNRRSKGSIPYGPIIRVSKSHNLTLDWVFFGEGDPFTNNRQVIAPVADIDAALMARITGEIWKALEGELLEEQILQDAMSRAGLAAQVFNKVAFVKSEKVRNDMIRERAEMLAHAAKWLT
ncbi:MAG: hypothetical protein DHS20C01_37830 [marine bacterium B5-7]|nr:MAG: hypothetical protein DHS20C01_37830 [marine bacterium B5-7]